MGFSKMKTCSNSSTSSAVCCVGNDVSDDTCFIGGGDNATVTGDENDELVGAKDGVEGRELRAGSVEMGLLGD